MGHMCRATELPGPPEGTAQGHCHGWWPMAVTGITGKTGNNSSHGTAGLNTGCPKTWTHLGWDTSGCCHCLHMECHCHHNLPLLQGTRQSPALPKCFLLMAYHTCKGGFLLGIPAWTLLSQGRWQKSSPAYAEPLLKCCHGRTATSRGLFPPPISGKCPLSRKTKQTLPAGLGTSPMLGAGSQQSWHKE